MLVFTGMSKAFLTCNSSYLLIAQKIALAAVRLAGGAGAQCQSQQPKGQ